MPPHFTTSGWRMSDPRLLDESRNCQRVYSCSPAETGRRGRPRPGRCPRSRTAPPAPRSASAQGLEAAPLPDRGGDGVAVVGVEAQRDLAPVLSRRAGTSRQSFSGSTSWRAAPVHADLDGPEALVSSASPPSRISSGVMSPPPPMLAYICTSSGTGRRGGDRGACPATLPRMSQSAMSTPAIASGCTPARPACRCGTHLVPEPLDLERVLAQHQRFQRRVHEVASTGPFIGLHSPIPSTPRRSTPA